jgi:pyroglutamyl-peptidase
VSTVLLTGFGPFDGADRNPARDAVRLVASGWDRPERLVTAELPVTWAGVGPELLEHIAACGPDLIVGVGLAGGRESVSLERLAVNLRDARIPDTDGVQPGEGPVVDGAPTALWATLPVKATVARLAAEGLPAELSMTAGTYLCNAMFFHAALWASERPGRRAGFVHVPWDRSGPGPDGVGMALTEIARAVRVAVDTALEVDEDVRTPLGRSD